MLYVIINYQPSPTRRNLQLKIAYTLLTLNFSYRININCINKNELKTQNSNTFNETLPTYSLMFYFMQPILVMNIMISI